MAQILTFKTQVQDSDPEFGVRYDEYFTDQIREVTLDSRMINQKISTETLVEMLMERNQKEVRDEIGRQYSTDFISKTIPTPELVNELYRRQQRNDEYTSDIDLEGFIKIKSLNDQMRFAQIKEIYEKYSAGQIDTMIEIYDLNYGGKL